MDGTHYHSRPALANPRAFLEEAGRDMMRAGPVAWRLFRSNVRARHQRAGLGYLWLVIPSLATTGVAAYLHATGVITVGTTAVPYPAYALIGVVIWQTFLDAMHAPLQQFAVWRQVLTRSRVPLEALVLAGVLDVGLNCAVRGVVLALACVLLGVTPGAFVWLAPLGLAAVAVLGLAIGLLLAPAGMLFDDVGRAMILVSTFWLFLTPVIYPLPAERLFVLNPVSPLLDTTRAWLTGGPVSPNFVPVAVISGMALLVGWVLQRLARPHLVARLG